MGGDFYLNVHKLPSTNILGELPQAKDFEINHRVSDFFLFLSKRTLFSKQILISLPEQMAEAAGAKAEGGRPEPHSLGPPFSPEKKHLWASENSLKPLMQRNLTHTSPS